jgi:hypothetical protein
MPFGKKKQVAFATLRPRMRDREMAETTAAAMMIVCVSTGLSRLPP